MENIIAITPLGQLSGVRADGVRTYLGVPYAEPPVGELRFKAPMPRRAWEGVRDANEAGPNAPQRTAPFPGLDAEALIGKGWSPGDDYLTLNIWQPDSDANGLPVMVFIHGGGFVIGSKDAPVSDGRAFARDGVICVAINYRMGVDGFLPIPGIPTNLGLRDQICALQWVRDNISAFGGDPANVTVFGESAGAMSVANLMASPHAKGLFRRAIIQSGHGAMTRDIGVAQRLVSKLAKILRIPATAEGFASVGHEALFDAMEKVSKPTARIDLRDADGFEPVYGISRFIPVHGDDVLPEPPLDSLRKGAGAEVELLIGTNSEEMNLYLVPTGVREKAGRLISWFVLRKSHPQAWAVLKAYGMGTKGRKPGQVLTDTMNDLVFRWPARRFAEEHRGKTHFYQFDWGSPAFGGQLGACHALEIPFVFDALASATGPQGLAGEAPPQELATHMHALWVRFASDGVLPWPEFAADTRMVYSLVGRQAANEVPMPAKDFLP
jgi:para-nitrobenzyl esterase